MGILWDSLLELDDLSSSTNSIMELMGTLLSSTLPLHGPGAQPPLTAPATNHAEPISLNLQNLVPRLWPFLSHTISSVRKSTLEALLILLPLGDAGSSPGGPPSAGDSSSAEGSSSAGGAAPEGGDGEVKVQDAGVVEGSAAYSAVSGVSEVCSRGGVGYQGAAA